MKRMALIFSDAVAETTHQSQPIERSSIRLENVSKRYRGGGGIENVNLEVGAGEVFGFLGPNGAGKTTTIRLLLDLIRPDDGRISIFGLDVRRDSVAIRRRIGYLPGDLALYDSLTARELLTHFCYLRGGPTWPEVASLVDRFGLELDRPIRALSKGNRQKVGLVQALMGKPQLLVLDEPTSGLDPLMQREVHSAIGEAAAEGRTVFLSSHVLSDVGRVARRVGLIRKGRVIAVKPVDELRGSPVHLVDLEFVERLDVGFLTAIPGVNSVERRGDGLHLEVSGSLDPLLQELARHRVAELSVREPDLEETFLDFYETDDATA
jgi:beta-exotoxin I transport system ATP-binding protein